MAFEDHLPLRLSSFVRVDADQPDRIMEIRDNHRLSLRELKDALERASEELKRFRKMLDRHI